MNTSAQPIAIAPNGDINLVIDQLETILLGKRKQLELAVACLLAKGHLLIEDVPGTGKTTLAQALGTSFGLDWSRVQFTSDLLPADVVGVSVFNSQTQAFEFRFVIATQNPAEQLGAYPLPESQLDRFLLGLSLGYPDAETERDLLRSGDRRSLITDLKPVANLAQLETWYKAVDAIHLSDAIVEYVQALLHQSRGEGTGLSPRAGLSLVRLSRAIAFIDGRDHVLPDDVQRVFPALAGHRLTGRVTTGESAALAILDAVTAP